MTQPYFLLTINEILPSQLSPSNIYTYIYIHIYIHIHISIIHIIESIITSRRESNTCVISMRNSVVRTRQASIRLWLAKIRPRATFIINSKTVEIRAIRRIASPSPPLDRSIIPLSSSSFSLPHFFNGCSRFLADK